MDWSTNVMSDRATLGLILALTVGGQLSFFLSIARLKQWVDEVATGVVSGVPVSPRHRSMMLWTTVMPLNFFVGVYLLLLGIGHALLAQTIDDPNARFLGYLIAGFSGLSFLGMMLLGTTQLIYLVSVLRRTERG
jgi:hypothetical protein